MTDAFRVAMPIYRIASLNIGGDSVIRNIKVIILPDQTRNILELNVLKKAAPFSFLMDPPAIMLSHYEARGS